MVWLESLVTLSCCHHTNTSYTSLGKKNTLPSPVTASFRDKTVILG